MEVSNLFSLSVSHHGKTSCVSCSTSSSLAANGLVAENSNDVSCIAVNSNIISCLANNSNIICLAKNSDMMSCCQEQQHRILSPRTRPSLAGYHSLLCSLPVMSRVCVTTLTCQLSIVCHVIRVNVYMPVVPASHVTKVQKV